MRVEHMANLYAPTLKEVPAEAEVTSHKLLLRAGFIRKLAAGLYTYLPLATKTLQNIETIIREELIKRGAQEVILPILGPAELWEESGRYGAYGPELMKIKDRHEREFVLGPTHEEIICDLVRGEVRSYKQLPLNLFQITDKFRDELRPRFGLMRSREFIMKDAYSFDATKEDMQVSYEKMYEAYTAICKRLGLTCLPVAADSGQIGGSHSIEFMALAQEGEAEIAYCECGYAADTEAANATPTSTETQVSFEVCKISTSKVASIEELSTFRAVKEGDPCPSCGKPLKVARGIEVGQIFQLGDKYSKPLNATYLDAQGNAHYFEMGCYGIGVSRMLAALAAQHATQHGMCWPLSVAAYPVEVIVLDEKDEFVEPLVREVMEELSRYDIDVLVDDRDVRPGVKFADAELMGMPIHIICGKRAAQKGMVELKLPNQESRETLPLAQVFEHLSSFLS